MTVPSGVPVDAAALALDGIVTLARMLTLTEWAVLVACFSLLAATFFLATFTRPFFVDQAPSSR